MFTSDAVGGFFAFAVSVLPVVVVLFLLRSRRVTSLEAGAVLVLWGLVIVVAEHVGFGVREFGGFDARSHDGLHFQMLAVYGVAGLALGAGVVVPLLRRGDALGWWGLLVLVVIGVGGELATAVVTTPHGMPPRFWTAGWFLWGYPVAWVVALVVSYRPILADRGDRTAGRSSGASAE
ncbi:MAG: hypothetical protein R3246_13995 [Acidimicrobiia bacterium]|nr:hypothetical protein [Acidimicrobiia bacterium]